MPFAFGRSLTYKFYPLKDELYGDSVQDLAKVTDTPSIYVFTSRPDRVAAAAGTGAQQTISSWSNTDDGQGKSFTIAAIDDPDADSAKDTYEYYIAINFTLQDSEQVQTVIRLLPMRRVFAHHTTAVPELDDFNAIHPNLTDHFTQTDIERAVKVAVRDVRARLKSNGYDWAEIWNPDDLRGAVAYRVLSILALSQANNGNSWELKYNEYSDAFDSIIKSVELLVDKDEDGVPEQPVKLISSVRLAR